MEDDLVVLVGTGIGGQKEILSALSDAGYDARSAGKIQWPRDHYVHFMGRYVKSGSPGFIDGNAFGEGGHILTGTDFLLVSDTNYLRESISSRLPENPSYEQIREEILAEGKSHHPDAKIHVAPTGYFHGGKGHDHIDMFSLLLPEQKILLLDTYYAKGASKAKEYDEVAESEGLKLIRYDGSQDNVWYPLNALVLPSKTDTNNFVVVDDKAKSLIKLLKNEGAHPVGVKMPQHSYPAGKINCQTNTFNLKDNITLDSLLERF